MIIFLQFFRSKNFIRINLRFLKKTIALNASIETSLIIEISLSILFLIVIFEILRWFIRTKFKSIKLLINFWRYTWIILILTCFCLILFIKTILTQVSSRRIWLTALFWRWKNNIWKTFPNIIVFVHFIHSRLATI